MPSGRRVSIEHPAGIRLGRGLGVWSSFYSEGCIHSRTSRYPRAANSLGYGLGRNREALSYLNLEILPDVGLPSSAAHKKTSLGRTEEVQKSGSRLSVAGPRGRIPAPGGEAFASTSNTPGGKGFAKAGMAKSYLPHSGGALVL